MRIESSETEVEQFRSRSCEHDIAGLEVSMDDPLSVCCAERHCNRDGDL